MSQELQRFVSEAWGVIVGRDLSGCDIEKDGWGMIDRGPIDRVVPDPDRKQIRLEMVWTARKQPDGSWIAIGTKDVEFSAYVASPPTLVGDMIFFDIPMIGAVKIFLNKEDNLDSAKVKGLTNR